MAFSVIAIILALPSAGAFNAAIDMAGVFVLLPLCVLVASRNTVSAFEGVLLVLGSASYPIYVLHAPVANIFLDIWPELSAYAPVSGIVLVVILVVLGVLLEKTYDIPVRRKLTEAFARRPVESDSR